MNPQFLLAVLSAMASLGCEVAAPPPQTMRVAPPTQAMAPEEASQRPKAHEGQLSENLPAAEAPTHAMPVEEFYESLKPAEADRSKYEGTWIEVTGELFDVEVAPHQRSGDLISAAVLRANDGTNNTMFVFCRMAPGELPWAKASKGSAVTVRGAFAKVETGEGYITDAKVVSDGDSSPNLTVEELAKLVANNPARFKENFGDSLLVVRGQFAGHEAPPGDEDSNADEYVKLVGKDNSAFYAYTGFAGQSHFEAYQEGDSVALLGNLYLFGEVNSLNDVTLSDTHDVTPFVSTKK